jgi:hypothetical protein
VGVGCKQVAALGVQLSSLDKASTQVVTHQVPNWKAVGGW